MKDAFGRASRRYLAKPYDTSPVRLSTRALRPYWLRCASSIAEGISTKSANEMVKDLVEGQEAVVRTCREAFRAADEAGDEPSCDLLTTRMQLHEKNAWMLRSLLANG